MEARYDRCRYDRCKVICCVKCNNWLAQTFLVTMLCEFEYVLLEWKISRKELTTKSTVIIRWPLQTTNKTMCCIEEVDRWWSICNQSWFQTKWLKKLHLFQMEKKSRLWRCQQCATCFTKLWYGGLWMVYGGLWMVYGGLWMIYGGLWWFEWFMVV